MRVIKARNPASHKSETPLTSNQNLPRVIGRDLRGGDIILPYISEAQSALEDGTILRTRNVIIDQCP